jgi:hypothetical protein
MHNLRAGRLTVAKHALLSVGWPIGKKGALFRQL